MGGRGKVELTKYWPPIPFDRNLKLETLTGRIVFKFKKLNNSKVCDLNLGEKLDICISDHFEWRTDFTDTRPDRIIRASS